MIHVSLILPNTAHIKCDLDTTFRVKRLKIKVTRPLYPARP